MNRILITGGFGFLGTHLIEILLKDKNNCVHVVDNLSSNPLPLDYTLKLIFNERLTYEIKNLVDFVPIIDYDEIYHLASVVGPAGILKYAGKISKNICDDICHIINISKKMKSKIVNVSSSEVYGGGLNGYCSENMNKIIQPQVTVRLEYAIGKLASEISLINAAKIENIDARIVRPFNISGPRQSSKGGFVLPRFILQSLKNEDLTVFGNGKQIRSFSHVIDVCEGIINTMKYGVNGQDYNLGNSSNKITIFELAEKVIKITKSKSKIVFVEPKNIYGNLYSEANDKFPDDTKSKKDIKWNPKYDIDVIIADTYYFLKNLDQDIIKNYF